MKKVKVSIKVKPGSKKGAFVQTSLTGELLVYVREPAVDGKANRAVVELLAIFFNVPKTNITIVAGHKNRSKIVQVQARE